MWNMKRFVGPERFYGLRVGDPVSVAPAGLTDSEIGTLVDFGWFSVEDLGGLPDRSNHPSWPPWWRPLLEMRPAIPD